MRKQGYLIICLMLCAGGILSQCRTLRELRALTKCEFRTKEIAQMDIGSVNALKIQSYSDLNLTDAGKLALEYRQGALPIRLTYLLEVRNPHEKTAALEQTDWILELDNQAVLNGTTAQRVEVGAGGTADLPISLSIDLKKLLAKESLSDMFNLVKAIGGSNEEQSRIRLKIKPRFIIAGITMGYPGYLKVGKTFKGAEQAR